MTWCGLQGEEWHEWFGLIESNSRLSLNSLVYITWLIPAGKCWIFTVTSASHNYTQHCEKNFLAELLCRRFQNRFISWANRHFLHFCKVPVLSNRKREIVSINDMIVTEARDKHKIYMFCAQSESLGLSLDSCYIQKLSKFGFN